ncbi:MAG: MFS transporter [Chlamydiae bacterium]|nr:MFS transporter [Chlamydiota bacterium]
MIFALLSVLYFLNVLSRMLFPMFALRFAKTYHLSPGMTGNIYLFLALGFGLSLFFSQFVSAKIGEQKTVCFSAIFSGLLLSLFPLIEDWIVFKFFLFALGALSGLFLPSAIAYLNRIFPQEKLGRSIGTFSSFQTIAMIFAPLIGGWARFSPGELFFLLGVLLIIFGSLFMVFAKNFLEKSYPPTIAYFKEVFRSRINQFLFAFQILAVGFNIGIYHIAPAYFLKSQAVSADAFFSLMSLSRILGIFASILCGFLIDFLGLRFSLIIGLLLTGSCTLFLGMFNPEDVLLVFCLQGPCAIALTTMVYIAISKAAAPERKASLISLFASSSFLVGAGIIPQIMGILGNWNLHSFGWIAFGTVGIFMGFVLYRKRMIFQKVGN